MDCYGLTRLQGTTRRIRAKKRKISHGTKVLRTAPWSRPVVGYIEWWVAYVSPSPTATATAIFSPNPNQASWGATCCATNLTTLASYSDANATESTVLAGLQLCFDHGVMSDEYTNARLSNSRCITAWATLCARDEVLGEWMQEKVRSEPDYILTQTL